MRRHCSYQRDTTAGGKGEVWEGKGEGGEPPVGQGKPLSNNDLISCKCQNKPEGGTEKAKVVRYSATVQG